MSDDIFKGIEKAGNRATPKQVDFLEQLYDRLGEYRPRRELQKLHKAEASELIDALLCDVQVLDEEADCWRWDTKY